ncbi:MAG: CAP domain-containing protein [Sphingobacteriales bacterium]|nr:MAG: CAP domain-containing protein [Sphingobacteriales bacterium]
MIKKRSIIAVVFIACCLNATKSMSQTEIDTSVLLSKVNELRAKGCQCGDKQMPATTPLIWNATLADAAQEHSVYMDKAQTLEHQEADGSRAGERITKKGYVWRTYGENVAMGPVSAEAVIELWKNSPSHCKNMMKADFIQMGVGQSGKYWTQVFGTPK